MKSHSRGMTLLEALAATVLLAILVGGCMPSLQKAFRGLADARNGRRLIEEGKLGQIVDEFMESPDAAGLADLGPQASRRFSHPGLPKANPLVVVDRLGSSERGPPDHVWLRFSCGATRVYRWCEAAEPAEHAMREAAR